MSLRAFHRPARPPTAAIGIDRPGRSTAIASPNVSFWTLRAGAAKEALGWAADAGTKL